MNRLFFLFAMGCLFPGIETRGVAQEPKKEPVARLIKVLMIEGSPRYEFRFCKSLLAGQKKMIDLKYLLLVANKELAKQDPYALADFPATAKELNAYDAVILGDVDPIVLGKEKLEWLAEFVKTKGGGLLLMAGQEISPHAYRDSPLTEILPIEPVGKAAKESEKERDTFRLEATAAGKNSFFRFHKEDKENEAILKGLASMHWFAEGYKVRSKAEVLAVHATAKGVDKKDLHPLMVRHTVGKGRCLFFGVEETWRWRFRENEAHHRQFWLKVVHYLGTSSRRD